MTTSPSLSVVMSVYNAAPYVKQAVLSVLNQDIQSFEFIIIDNASTDESRAIIQSILDPRILLIENEQNLGPPGALNQGLGMARGKYIARMDADDVALHSRMSLQVEFLERNPQCAVVGTQALAINQFGESMYTLWYPTTSSGICWKLMFTSPVAHSSVMMRREVVTQIGGYNEKFRHGADYDLWSRLASEGHDITNLAGTHMHIRMHGESDGHKGQGRLLFEEIVGISHSNIRQFLKLDITVDEVRSMILLVTSNNWCPKEQIYSAVVSLQRIANAIGDEAKLYHAWMLMRLASTSRDLTLTIRAKCLVRGILTFVNCQKSELKTRFWKDWVFSGAFIHKILSGWQRSS